MENYWQILHMFTMGYDEGRGPDGDEKGGYTPSIAMAVKRLRQDFDQPLRIE